MILFPKYFCALFSLCRAVSCFFFVPFQRRTGGDWRPHLVQPKPSRWLFASARVVVGPHGAGLGNAMFMAPGGAIVELMPVGRYNGCYGNFAFAYRLKWYHTPVSYQKAGDGSIHLNATSLARAVALTLEAWNATTDVRPAITVLGEPELHDACSR